MTDPDIDFHEPEPPGAAGDASQPADEAAAAEQPFNTVVDESPLDEAAEQPHDQNLDNVADADSRPPPDAVAEPEPQEELEEAEPAPEDWHEPAKLPVGELERQMAEAHRTWNRHSYAAWLQVMRIIPRVRAYKNSTGGARFEAACKKYCRIGKNAAHQIVARGLADPPTLQKIWDGVLAEAHAAGIRGDRYDYPTLNKLLNWYKPEDEADGQTSDNGDDDGADGDDGANDPRTKPQLRADLLTLQDDARKLTLRAVKAEQRLSATDDELSQKLTQLREQADSLALLRQSVNEFKRQRDAALAEVAVRDAAIAERDAEIARLKALIIPPNDNNAPDDPNSDFPDPDNDLDPVPDQHPPAPPDPPIDPSVAHRIDAILDQQLPESAAARIDAAVAGMDQLCASPDFTAGAAAQWIREIIQKDEKLTKQLFEYGTIRLILNEAFRIRPDRIDPPAKRTIRDATRTDIDARWNAPKLRGGGRASDENRALAKANRIAAYELLDDESDVIAQDAIETLNRRTISFFWRLTPDMDLEAILKMPEKP
jgi:hypothetical protein